MMQTHPVDRVMAQIHQSIRSRRIVEIDLDPMRRTSRAEFEICDLLRADSWSLHGRDAEGVVTVLESFDDLRAMALVVARLFDESDLPISLRTSPFTGVEAMSLHDLVTEVRACAEDEGEEALAPLDDALSGGLSAPGKAELMRLTRDPFLWMQPATAVAC